MSCLSGGADGLRKAFTTEDTESTEKSSTVTWSVGGGRITPHLPPPSLTSSPEESKITHSHLH